MKEPQYTSSALHERSGEGKSSTKSALKRPQSHADGGGRDQDSTGDSATASQETKTNDGAEDTITVLAHVKEKIIPVHCGFGTQQVLWLAHVAVARYDEERCQGWLALGVPTRIVKDGAKHALKPTDLICDVLPTNSHVYISTSLG